MSQQFIHPDQLQKSTTENYSSPSLEQILAGVKARKKFIPVKGVILDRHIPEGYALVEKQFGSQKFSILLPNKLVYFVSHPGEGGNPLEALSSVSEFYNEVREFEKGLISEGKTNAIESNWAVRAGESYETYLVNYIISGETKGGNLTPGYNLAVLEELNIPLISLKDLKFSATRDQSSKTIETMKLIASICLGVSPDQLAVCDLGNLVKHVTISEEKTLSGAEASTMACYMGSHWELKPEYRINPITGAEREIARRGMGQALNVEEFVRQQQRALNLDLLPHPFIKEKGESYISLPKVDELLNQLVTEVKDTVRPEIVPHLKNIYSMYINMGLIGEANPQAWLPTEPPKLSKEV